MQIELAGTQLVLLPQKALFLPSESILVIGDLHLGKAMHFRKAGIFMPADSARKDYETLAQLLQQYNPQQVFFLGDLFHSTHNSEWQLLAQFLQTYPHINFMLIKGNHDILNAALYQQLRIEIVPETLNLHNLIFSHEPMDTVPEGKVNISGHIHPGCVVKGLGRQYLRLPCFYLKDNCLLLPAFGHLTGLHILDTKQATVFAVLPERVVVL
jgi:DNA ligase-associated metallophosphoesterase